MAKYFKEGKKNLFLMFFGVIFLFLSFWTILASKAEACEMQCDFTASKCTYQPNFFGITSLACAVNTDLAVGGVSTDPCLDNVNNTACKLDSCPDNFNRADGSKCEILNTTSLLVGCTAPFAEKTGNWDASKSQCVGCNGLKEGDIYNISGNTLSIVSGDGNLESACSSSVVSDCDDKAVGASCNGTGTCQSDGTCLVAGALTLTANPESIIANVPSSIEFTVTVGTNPESGVSVAITGPGISANCTTTSNGKCIVSVTANAAGTATATATKSPLTPGTKNITITAANALIVESSPSSIPANTPRSIIFGVKNSSGAFLPNMTVELSGGYTGNCVTGDGTGGGGMFGKCSVSVTVSSNITVIATDSSGVYADSAPIVISVTGGPTVCTAPQCNPANPAQYCLAGAWVNCSGTDICSGGACVPATACQPAVLNCGTALTASDAGCLCGADFVKASDAGYFCCGSYGVLTTQALCTAQCSSGPTCAAGDGCKATGCTPPDPDCSSGPTCAAGDGCKATGCTPADPDCGGGGGSNCSGPGMYPSPLMFGYCTIPEIITAAINWILGIAASIIILILIFGGITYVTSAGDEERIRTAKNTILYAIIGLAIILLAYTLITEVKDILKITA